MVRFLLISALFCSLAAAQSTGSGETNGRLKEPPGLNPEMRLKLWEISELPPDQLEAALSKWPRYQGLTPDQRTLLRQRMDEMKSRLYEMAMNKAKDYGLTISPEEEDSYTKTYIRRRLEEEVKIWNAMKPLREAMEKTLKEEMQSQYGNH